jgi:hypothetical protein
MAKTQGLIFTTNCHKFTISHISGTNETRIWQFMVKRARVLADRIKTMRDLQHLNKYLIFYAEIYIAEM